MPTALPALSIISYPCPFSVTPDAMFGSMTNVVKLDSMAKQSSGAGKIWNQICGESLSKMWEDQTSSQLPIAALSTKPCLFHNSLPTASTGVKTPPTHRVLPCHLRIPCRLNMDQSHLSWLLSRVARPHQKLCPLFHRSLY